jgi:glycosyltransferase involved in cell wall biosynthesis
MFGTLLDRYPGQYELHQVALFHSHAVAEPRWPLYLTRSAKDDAGTPVFLIADVDGQMTFREVVSKVGPHIVFAFNDPQRVLHLCDPPDRRPYKLVLYVNFDGFPYPPDQGPVLNRADLIVTMSAFAERIARSSLPALDPAKVFYMYSPADTLRFSPLSECERTNLRASALPGWMPRDAFVLGWVGRCQWRKQVWLPYLITHHLRSGDYLLCAVCGRVTVLLSPRRRRHTINPRDQMRISELTSIVRACDHCGSADVRQAHPLPEIFLWVHMPEEPVQQDWSRDCLESFAGVVSGRDIHYTQDLKVGRFQAPVEMAALYRSWDCLLYLSGGEGFGLPAWEAMCSGLPVVYTNYSSHGEYLGIAHAGLAVGGAMQPEAGSCIWRMVADVPQAVEAVRKLYFDRSLTTTLSRNGLAFVKNFTLENQAERWHEIFQQVVDHGSCRLAV